MQAPRSEPHLQQREEGSAASEGRRRSAGKRLKTPSEAASTRYYFNIRSDRALIEDTKGRTLPDLAAALQRLLLSRRPALRKESISGRTGEAGVLRSWIRRMST